MLRAKHIFLVHRRILLEKKWHNIFHILIQSLAWFNNFIYNFCFQISCFSGYHKTKLNISLVYLLLNQEGFPLATVSPKYLKFYKIWYFTFTETSMFSISVFQQGKSSYLLVSEWTNLVKEGSLGKRNNFLTLYFLATSLRQ